MCSALSLGSVLDFKRTKLHCQGRYTLLHKSFTSPVTYEPCTPPTSTTRIYVGQTKPFNEFELLRHYQWEEAHPSDQWNLYLFLPLALYVLLLPILVLCW